MTFLFVPQSSVQHNASVSPDFKNLNIKDGPNHFFCLTGSELGAPRRDKTKEFKSLLAAGIVKSKRELKAEMRTKPPKSARGAERRAHGRASAAETSGPVALSTAQNLTPPTVVPEQYPVSFTPHDFMASPPVVTNNVFGQVPAMTPGPQGPPAFVLPQEFVDFLAHCAETSAPTVQPPPPSTVVPEQHPVLLIPQDFILSPPVIAHDIFGQVPAMMPDPQSPPAFVLPQGLVDFLAYYGGEGPVADAGLAA